MIANSSMPKVESGRWRLGQPILPASTYVAATKKLPGFSDRDTAAKAQDRTRVVIVKSKRTRSRSAGWLRAQGNEGKRGAAGAVGFRNRNTDSRRPEYACSHQERPYREAFRCCGRHRRKGRLPSRQIGGC